MFSFLSRGYQADIGGICGQIFSFINYFSIGEFLHNHLPRPPSIKRKQNKGPLDALTNLITVSFYIPRMSEKRRRRKRKLVKTVVDSFSVCLST